MAPSEQLALAVNRVAFLRPLEKFRVMALCSSTEQFANLSRADMEQILQRRFDDPGLPTQYYLEAAERDRKSLTQGRFQCTFYWSGEYPHQLREIYDPPLLLYHRGQLPDWSEPLVAIVGTRHPTGQARGSSYALAFELAGLGFTTVSGLARGIDAEAHRGSSDAGGRSIAVLGNGVDILFPGSSARVGRIMLAAGGVVLSEYPPGDPPLARNFPARNRIISGLARTTVVIQAPARSGALITADYALEQGRELMVHRVGTAGERGAGSRRLAEQGAAVIDGAADILEDWGWLRGEDKPIEHAPKPQNSLDAGKQLARALEAELAGHIVYRSGEIFERNVNGK
jgi:DNA processing protein